MKRLTTLLLCVSMLVFILAACGGGDKKSESGGKGEKATVTFGFWGTAEDLKVYQSAADSINEAYPNITLKIKQYPSSDQFWNQLPGEIAAGTAPDLVRLSNEGSYEYITKDLFAPLDEYIKSANLDMSVYIDSAKNGWQVEGKTFGIPNTFNTSMFFINDEMWKAAGLGAYPTTWDEVYEAAKKLKTKDVYGLVANIHEFHITNYVKTFGGGWGYGKTINSKENVQGLEQFMKFYKDDLAVTPKTLGYGWDGEVFANKKAAMTTGGAWYKSYLKDANPDLKYVALPVPKGTVQAGNLIADGYTVMKDSKNKEAAVKAAYFMSGEKVQSQFIELGYNPPLKSLSPKYYDLNPEFKSTESALANATDFQYPSDTKKFTDALVKEVENAILGGSKETAQQILDKVQQQFNK
ncbi:sugar ABC transporter substrate-binding protein [Cohnella endophytica]|uniref:Sugar ABC transporter substrate-binding protein n=1 Tax=Cohnella endophytica TaxID=2419778 RepID=A0A494XTS6_9BACL|nr:sugar ABC transporter substrate-binding protein [Cohnella endophytica]RKP51499.1 sugar ABC transporter substrate-binding protein [Cohnella endophytica]